MAHPDSTASEPASPHRSAATDAAAAGGLTHFDASGRAHMVDVGGKPATHRVAVAQGRIRMKPDTLQRIREGSAAKGDVLGIARIAGIQAAKRTGDLIPLCHPLMLTRVAVDLQCETGSDTTAESGCVTCEATVETVGPTGVEMEALTAVQVALLTVYDMVKAVDRDMEIGGVRVVHKRGGRSGWHGERSEPGMTGADTSTPT